MSATLLEGPLGPVLLKVIGSVRGPEEVAAVAALLAAPAARRRPSREAPRPGSRSFSAGSH